MKRDWKLLKDELPKKNGNYYVFYNDGHIEMRPFERNHTRITENVYAWMPAPNFPEPPQQWLDEAEKRREEAILKLKIEHAIREENYKRALMFLADVTMKDLALIEPAQADRMMKG